MNVANWLTLARVLTVPLFLTFLLRGIPEGEYIAAVIFALAAVTDGLDGYLARSRKEITSLGKFLDPLADKVLVSAALVGLVELGWVPGWIVVTIITREFAVTGLRTIAASQGKTIDASQLGKYKTLAQMVAIIALMIHDFPASLWGISIGMPALYLALALTIISAVDYFIKARDLFRN